MAKKIIAGINCERCKESLICTNTANISERHKKMLQLIMNRDQFGVLHKPTETLIDLIVAMDDIARAIDLKEMDGNFFFELLHRVEEELGTSALVGCELHKENVTSEMISFFLIMRVRIFCDDFNSIIIASKTKKAKVLRKTSKLY